MTIIEYEAVIRVRGRMEVQDYVPNEQAEALVYNSLEEIDTQEFLQHHWDRVYALKVDVGDILDGS